MSRLTRDGTAEPVSRDQILRHIRGQGNIHFPCSADHEQDWQPYPVDRYSAMPLLLLFLTFSALVANPKKILYTVANPARGLQKKKKKSGSDHPSPPPPRCSFGENKIKFTRRIHMLSRRCASRRYAGLGPSRVRTRIPTTRRLGQWVLLRKILRFRVR